MKITENNKQSMVTETQDAIIVEINASEIKSELNLLIIEKLNAFIREYNLTPKLLILNFNTYDTLLTQLGHPEHVLGRKGAAYLEFAGIKVVRSSDIEFGDVRFGF
jgi:hypothetical protein